MVWSDTADAVRGMECCRQLPFHLVAAIAALAATAPAASASPSPAAAAGDGGFSAGTPAGDLPKGQPGVGAVKVGHRPKHQFRPPRIERFDVLNSPLRKGSGKIRAVVRVGHYDTRHVSATIDVIRRGAHRKRVRRVELPDLRVNRDRTVRLKQTGLGPGNYSLRLNGSDRYGKGLARTAGVARSANVRLKPKPKPAPPPPAPPAPTPPTPGPGSGDHAFPIAGPFSWGGDGSKFGAPRPGHIHQGQDLSAAEGTPLVAIYRGTIQHVGYQESGAGNYVVLDADDGRDYVYMHMKTGSTVVTDGQGVARAEKLGEVGSTGASSGPHLHFEVWEDGPWYGGGHAVDPLPYLQAWD